MDADKQKIFLVEGTSKKESRGGTLTGSVDRYSN
jgi:hypothetical protein